MKEDIILQEKIKLLDQELITVTEKLDAISRDLKEIEDLKQEIKGMKLFLGRANPDFKTKFPEIMQKLYKKK